MKCVLYEKEGCPQCRQLAKALNERGIDYEEVVGADKIMEKGYMSAPILEVDGKVLKYKEAFNWVIKGGREQ